MATRVFQIMAWCSAVGCGSSVITTMCVTSCKENFKINKIICIFYFLTGKP